MLDELPCEILETLFKNCDPDTLGSLCQTNDRFKIIIESSKSLMNLVCFSDDILERICIGLSQEKLIDLMSVSKHFARVIPNSPSLMSSISIHIHDRDIDTKNGTIKERLQIFMDDSEQLNSTFLECGNIRNLSLHGKISLDNLKNCKKVTNLKLKCLAVYDMTNLHKLLDLFPQLEHLTFNYPSSITGEASIDGRQVRHLQSITMMPNTAFAFNNYLQVKSIVLKFNYVKFDDEAWWPHLENMLELLDEQKNLEEVEFKYLNFEQGEKVELGEMFKEMIIDWFRKNKGLKSVYFSSCKGIGDLIKVVFAMDVQKIHINHQCYDSSIMEDWPETLKPNPHILEFTMDGCYDNFFLRSEIFTQLMPNIRRIDLDAIVVAPGLGHDDNDFPTVDGDWKNFADNLPSLEYLEVPMVHSRCKFLGDYRFEALKTLSIGWIEFNDHDNLMWLRFADTFPNITKLEIKLSEHLTRERIRLLLKNFTNLEVLELGSLSRDAVEFVFQNPKNLKIFKFEFEEFNTRLAIPGPDNLLVVECDSKYFEKKRRFSVTMDPEQRCYCRLDLKHWKDSFGIYNVIEEDVTSDESSDDESDFDDYFSDS